MGRAQSLGSSLADALSELATEVRDARRSAATERARKAPVKMLFARPANSQVKSLFWGGRGHSAPSVLGKAHRERRLRRQRSVHRRVRTGSRSAGGRCHGEPRAYSFSIRSRVRGTSSLTFVQAQRRASPDSGDYSEPSSYPSPCR
jgi:hypothetical protein